MKRQLAMYRFDRRLDAVLRTLSSLNRQIRPRRTSWRIFSPSTFAAACASSVIQKRSASARFVALSVSAGMLSVVSYQSAEYSHGIHTVQVQPQLFQSSRPRTAARASLCFQREEQTHLIAKEGH